MKFMGFLDGQKAMWYYDLFKHTMHISQNVAFSENDEPHKVEFQAINQWQQQIVFHGSSY